MGRVPVVDLDIISFGRGYYSQLIKQKVDMIEVCKIKTCEIQVCEITMTISTDYRVDSTDSHSIQRSHKKKKKHCPGPRLDRWVMLGHNFQIPSTPKSLA